MPNNLTDVNAFTTPVQVPAGSDDAGLTYLLTALQALANRTHYLNKLANDVTERTFVVSPFAAKWSSGWAVSGTVLVSSANSATLRLPLDFLPNGAVVKRIKALVTPGAGTMSMDVYSHTLDFVTPAGGSATGIELGINSSGTAVQVLTTSALTETIARAAGKNHFAFLTANSSGGSSPDTLFGFQIVADLVGIGAF